MAKQQTLFDREREKAVHDQENSAYEREEMKRLNDQLFAQITTFQNTREPPPSLKGPLLRKPKAANIFKAAGDTSQTLQLSRNNPTADRIRHISARRINATTLGERL